MTATASQTPITDHLWQIGFRLEFTVKPLLPPMVLQDAEHGSTVYNSQTKLTAYPERGEARRLFAGKGPAAAEAYSNFALEAFENEDIGPGLKQSYTESNARTLLAMLEEEAPTLSKPRAVA